MVKKIIKENLVYIISIIILIIIFTLIKNSFLYEKILNFDHKIITYRDNIIDEKLTLSFKHITFFGDYYIPILIIMCIFIFNKNKYHSYVNFVNYISVLIVTFISKIIVNRARPDVNLVAIPDKYSFPSGHTLTSIVFYFFLCYVATMNRSTRKYLLPLVLIVIISISISRIYLGVHYFSDVIGAILLSIPLLLMNINIFNKHVKEKLL